MKPQKINIPFPIKPLHAFVLAGCLFNVSSRAESSFQERAFKILSSLSGTWVEVNDLTSEAIIKMDSGDTIITESFSGMLNIIHMDLGKLILTHYCMAGNQPKFELKEVKELEAGTYLDFALVSVGNLLPNQGHISDVDYLLQKDGSVKEFWAWKQPSGMVQNMEFQLQRKAN